MKKDIGPRVDFEVRPGEDYDNGETVRQAWKSKRPLECCSLCKRAQSRWTCQNKFVPTRRVPQDAGANEEKRGERGSSDDGATVEHSLIW